MRIRSPKLALRVRKAWHLQADAMHLAALANSDKRTRFVPRNGTCSNIYSLENQMLEVNTLYIISTNDNLLEDRVYRREIATVTVAV